MVEYLECFEKLIGYAMVVALPCHVLVMNSMSVPSIAFAYGKALEASF